MKQESMKVLFFIRKSRLKKNGEAPIFLRVTINGQLDEVRIQRSVPLKLWDNVKERSKGKDRSINRKTFCDVSPNHFVSVLHLLTQNELRFFYLFSNTN